MAIERGILGGAFSTLISRHGFPANNNLILWVLMNKVVSRMIVSIQTEISQDALAPDEANSDAGSGSESQGLENVVDNLV